ncbi:hypothetical protein D1BOALGB6SA_4623 [Olavius sp. associated proteobacterium Delta 1]|nr:hypothetical protein D1BOALGB6SA_4623 [Olavius sp. associated proteobacterium Delta 1]
MNWVPIFIGLAFFGLRDRSHSRFVMGLFVGKAAGFSPLRKTLCLELYMKKQTISSDTDLVR